MPEVWEGKSYKMTESDKFDEYMKALGVGFVLRKIGNSTTPTVELKKEGDQFTLITSSTFKTSTITFKLGEEFEEETLDGRKVKSTITADGNKFTHKQDGSPESTIVREFSDKELVATMVCGDVTCTRKYAAAE